jgi:hypothetical protein
MELLKNFKILEVRKYFEIFERHQIFYVFKTLDYTNLYNISKFTKNAKF